nr:peptidylprolyl isomerase [Rhizomicrobium palustre]
MQALTDRFIRQQIFVREGKALGLDKGDEIVERRIAQKYEFLQQDLGAPDVPDDATLKRWYDAHKVQYLTGPRVAFTQVYFSPDRDGEAGAKARAEKTLATLAGGHETRAPALGDAFPGPSDLPALSKDDAVRLFGDSQLSSALVDVAPGKWVGPFRSGYGWHLVYVSHRLAPSLPGFADIKGRLADDYREEQRRLENARAYEKLRVKYRVAFEGGR